MTDNEVRRDAASEAGDTLGAVAHDDIETREFDAFASEVDDLDPDELETREFDPFSSSTPEHEASEEFETREYDPFAVSNTDDATVVDRTVSQAESSANAESTDADTTTMPPEPRRIVRKSALSVPSGPTRVGVPPTAKPVRLVGAAQRGTLPPAIPPAAARSELPSWDAITSGNPIAVDAATEAQRAAPIELPPSFTPTSEQPAVASRVDLSEPKPTFEVSDRLVPEVSPPTQPSRPGWRWWQLALTYLVLFALMALAGWFFWMWFARDELAAQRESNTNAQGQAVVLTTQWPLTDVVSTTTNGVLL